MSGNYLVEMENTYEQFSNYTMAKEFYDLYKNRKKVRLILGVLKPNSVVEIKELL